MADKEREESFEDKLAHLEKIVNKLESGDVALEDAIQEFQVGMNLADQLKKTLDAAEETLVKAVGKDGKEEEFKPVG